jgi:Family of unknown function (DUF5994)
MSTVPPFTTADAAAAGRRGMVVAEPSPLAPRLMLVADRAGRAVVDGGWWPRSWDPAAELAGLVPALSARFGPIRQVMLCSGTWEGRFRRLKVGETVVRLGWFASLDPALLVALTHRGDQIDLMVVPPSTGQFAAEQAMRAAADPGNLKRAAAILAAATASPISPVAEVDGALAAAVWDNEGGSIAANGVRPS